MFIIKYTKDWSTTQMRLTTREESAYFAALRDKQLKAMEQAKTSKKLAEDLFPTHNKQ